VAGSATRITIRGNNSLLGNNQPLFVVDGVPFNNDTQAISMQLNGGGAYASGISGLDPNNIASMSILKGGAAAALYGSRAANGVIVITTKTGTSRPSNKGLEISFNSNTSFETIASLPDYQNTYGTGTKFSYAASNGSWGLPSIMLPVIQVLLPFPYGVILLLRIPITLKPFLTRRIPTT